MARDLALRITADDSQARPVLARNEQSVRNIEAAAQSADAKWAAFSQRFQAEGAKNATTAGQVETKARAMGESINGAAIAGGAIGGALGFAVGKVIGFVAEAGKASVQIQAMAKQTGLTAEGVQFLGAVARENGGNLRTYAEAVGQMTRRLAEAKDPVRQVVERLGIDFQALRAMKPEDQLLTLAAHLRDIGNIGTRNSYGVKLFGEQWDDIAPGVLSNLEEVRRATMIAGEAQVQALSEAERAYQRFLENMKTATISFFGAVALAAKQKGFWGTVFSDIASSGGANIGRILALGSMEGTAAHASAPKPNGPPLPLPTHKPVLSEAEKEYAAYLKSVQNLADELNDNKLYLDMIKLSDAIEANGGAAEIAGRKLPGLVKQIDEFRDANFHLTPELDAVLERYRDWIIALDEIRAGVGEVERTVEELGEIGSRVRDEVMLAVDGAYWNSIIAPPGGLQPGPTVYLGPKPADTTNLQHFTDVLVFANNVMGQFGHSNTIAWQAASSGIQIGIQYLGQYIAAQKIAGATQRAAAISAAGTSAAMAGATLGISLGIQALVSYINKIQQYKRDRDALWGQLAAFGIQPPSRDATGLGRDDYLHYLQDQLDAAKQRSEDVTTAIGRFGDALELFGKRAPNAFRPFIDALLQSNRLTESQRAALQGLMAAPDYKQILQTAQDVGLDEGNLGSGYQQLKVNTLAKQYLGQFTQLTDIGAPTDAVLKAFVDEIQGLINTGMSIPRFLKDALVDPLIGMGLLKDASGQTLTDSLSLQFNDLKSPLDEQLDVLKQIRDLLQISIPDAALIAAGLKPNPIRLPTQGPSLGSDGMHISVTYNVHAIDGQSVGELLRRDGGAIASQIADAVVMELPDSKRRYVG